MSFSKDQLRAIAFYEWLRGNPSSTAVRNMKGALGEVYSIVPTMYRWFARIAEGNMVFEITSVWTSAHCR